ncbi:septum formation family protein [Candidatus Mycobacterium wuenschmannii]|uniref:Septum formation family protein n=2 Tax=Candidatus Mycobacterium wuenschmannii TaxID=3027808 RepID=A0ABY8VSG9_9MYCO|nr:septum formation family protein [Candidatus Mycobacterium wuenschmannii]WIM86580.1 septum formation family protein [Candidatus Mycobacterium wuenschmannii]
MWHHSDHDEHDADEAAVDDAPKRRRPRVEFLSSLNGTLQASATRRALLLTALGGLLIAGLVTALPIGGGPGRLAGYIDPVPPTGAKGNDAFNRAASGNCLMWPDRMPEAANVVDCKDEHRFEVAESIDMRTFPGSEYGPSAPPPTATRIEQISQEQCESAVRRYLGAKFDPNSKFVISMLWSGDKAWRQFGERRMLCGLQLPGAGNQQVAYKGKVADVDQSKVWPDGTCLGIDPATNQPTDIPVDCVAPHAMEVTGTVNLLARFPEGLPPEPEQDAFIKDACTKQTDAYLAPVQLRSTTLTLIYSTLSLPSWSADSREVACSIGATLGNGGWATLLNSAKGALKINGQSPVPPPDIPQERLNLPPIPTGPNAPEPSGGGAASTGSNGSSNSSGSNGSSGSSGSSSQRQGNQHLPGQQAPAPQSPAPQQPAPQQPAPQQPPPEGPAPQEGTPPGGPQAQPPGPEPQGPAPGQ